MSLEDDTPKLPMSMQRQPDDHMLGFNSAHISLPRIMHNQAVGDHSICLLYYILITMGLQVGGLFGELRGLSVVRTSKIQVHSHGV